MIIYKIYNKLTRQIYIGQTKQELAKRIYQHCYANSKIGIAIRKYGIENFDISIIDYAETKKELDELEIFWISWYKSNICGYNILSGGIPTKNEMKKLKKFKGTRINKQKNCNYNKIMNKIENKKSKVYEFVKLNKKCCYKELEQNTGVRGKMLKDIIGKLICDGRIDRIKNIQSNKIFIVALR